MIKGKCKDCKRVKLLTKHSEVGSHLAPYVYLCRECHDKRHGLKGNYTRRSQRGSNGKKAKGTRRVSRTR